MFWYPTLEELWSKKHEGGLNVNPLIATKQLLWVMNSTRRNIAASCFLKVKMAPIITDMDMPEDEKSQVIKFRLIRNQFSSI